jgi:hypothetical protein
VANGNGGFDPTRLQDWTVVLHNAAKVRPGSPDYDEARATAGYALQMIGHLNRVQNQADLAQAAQPDIAATPFASGLEGFVHGASLGLGEPIAGLGSALTGGSFREGAERYREGLSNLEAANPNLAATTEILGGLAPFAAPTTVAAQAIKPGVALGIRAGAQQLAKAGATGAGLGAVSGFSRGGADPGDLAARLEAAKSDAITSGILATALAGLGMARARQHVERMADLNEKGNARALTEARLALARARLARETARPLPTAAAPADVLPGGVSEAAARAQLQQLNFPADQIDAALAQARTAAAPASAAPVPAIAPAAVPTIEPTPPPRAVPAGLSQRATPATRVQSPPANLISQAIKLSGQAPELLRVEGETGYAVPTEHLRSHLALLDMLAPGTQKATRAAIETELARRAAAGKL